MIQKELTEKELLHNPFKKILDKHKLKYIHKNDARNHARGSDSGYPDFIIFLDNGIVLLIEFKKKEKYFSKLFGLRPKQVEWRDYLREKNFRYLLTYKLKDAIDFVEFYLK